jgi:Type II secretion system (T2SS), protein G
MSTFQAPGGTFGVPEQPRRGANVMGIAGFALALVSLVLCCVPYVGMLAVPALILSVIGLFHPKKGLAIAGTIIATITALLALIYLLIIINLPKATGGLGILDMIKGAAVAGAVTEATKAANGTLPADLTTTGLPPVLTSDRWGTPFIYTPRGDGTFTLASAGPDKTAGTSDDVDIGATLLQNQQSASDFPNLRALSALPETTTPAPETTDETKPEDGANPADPGTP